MTGPPAVLIMARAPRRGEVRRALEPVLGVGGCLALQSALITQAGVWAAKVAPGNVHVAHDPPDAGRELRDLLPDEVKLFPQNGDGIAGRLADAAGRVFARTDRALLIVWPDLPRLRPELAVAATGDLSAGCDVTFGLARPLPQLFALSEQSWRSADAMTLAVGAARDAELEVGILRAERALHRPADVRAALADPLLPDDLRRILSGRR